MAVVAAAVAAGPNMCLRIDSGLALLVVMERERA